MFYGVGEGFINNAAGPEITDEFVLTRGDF